MKQEEDTNICKNCGEELEVFWEQFKRCPKCGNMHDFEGEEL